MNATLRALIIWLLLLATPLQGFASVTQLLCAPPPATAHASMSDADESHATATAAGDGHLAAHDHAAGESTPVHHHPDGKCGNCATCCCGASMAPSAVTALPVHVPQFTLIPFDPRHLQSAYLALPERPPRA